MVAKAITYQRDEPPAGARYNSFKTACSLLMLTEWKLSGEVIDQYFRLKERAENSA